ncbi:MAG: Trk system potassium transporter TrkA [Clostridia bacterium]|nr:Trk system potassium transporter TrkA [Clostridia bacterium]
MNLVIVGAGRVGGNIAKQLSAEQQNIIVVDNNPTVVQALVNGLDVLGIVGNGSSADILKQAGVPAADIVLATMCNDESNIFCSLISKALGAKKTIARVREPIYVSQSDFLSDTLGIDVLVNPELETAEEIARCLRYPWAEHVETINTFMDIVGVRIELGSPLAGVKLAYLSKEMKLNVLACAIDRGGDVVIPGGDTAFEVGDVAFFTGLRQSLAALMRKLGIDTHLRSVLIIGGGRISEYLAGALIETGMRVKIIEQNRERCEYLSEKFPRASIVCGDGCSKEVLVEEGIGVADCVASLTGSDEANILLSLFAKSQKVGKIVTKINGDTFNDFEGALDLGTIVSPRTVLSEGLIRFTRSMQAPETSGIRALYKIANDRAEALAFSINEKSEVADKKIRDLKIKKGVLIASLIRGKECIFPDGDTVLRVGDEVLVVSAKYKFKQLKDILA